MSFFKSCLLLLLASVSVGAHVCFAIYGMSRSANYTHASFEKYLLEPLRLHNISYTVYFHTWLPRTVVYNNHWSGETALNLSVTDYRYIPADVVEAEIEPLLDIKPYAKFGDPWRAFVRERGGTVSHELEHVIYSLMSLWRVTQMWKNGAVVCQTVICTRPDFLFVHPLQTAWLNTSNVLTPNFSAWPINDRFALGPADKMVIYGERFDLALVYAQRKAMHTEAFLAYVFALNKWSSANRIDFCFFRMRANGLAVPEIGKACNSHVQRLKKTLAWVPPLFRQPQYKRL